MSTAVATSATRHGGCDGRRIRSVTAPSRRHPTRQWLKVAASTLSESGAFPGFPELLWQTRSKVTGDPVRIVQLPQNGILGGGGGMLGLSFQGFVGARVLLVDETNDISSVYVPDDPGRLTGAYWDAASLLDPLLPSEGSLGIMGLGGGTAAVNVHRLWPERTMEGWDYDEEVVKAARLHLGIAELETAATGGLTVNIGSAFGAKSADTEGFAGLFVDLFAKSDLLLELERPQTWASWLASLRPGGRLMANLGGAEQDDEKAAERVQASFMALAEACDFQMSVLNDESGVLNNMLVISGPPLDQEAWQAALPEELRPLAANWVELS